MHARTRAHTLHKYTYTHATMHGHAHACAHLTQMLWCRIWAQPQAALQHLLSSSGKLQLLDRMMERLLAQGHRVLIYSQVCVCVCARVCGICILRHDSKHDGVLACARPICPHLPGACVCVCVRVCVIFILRLYKSTTKAGA